MIDDYRNSPTSIVLYIRIQVTRTPKGNEKQFELAGNELSGVNCSEILIKRKDIEFELAGNSSYLSSSYLGSTVGKKKKKKMTRTHGSEFIKPSNF